MAISLSCLHSPFALSDLEIIQQFINMAVSAGDLTLLHESFKNWKLSFLVTTHPWMTESCTEWHENGKCEYWQLMTHCPFCRRVIPRKNKLGCCGNFNELIWPKTVIEPSSFSPLHKNRVYIHHTWSYYRERKEYWIQVIICLACGQPLSSAQQPCCRASFMRRLDVGEVGSSSCTMPAPKQS